MRFYDANELKRFSKALCSQVHMSISSNVQRHASCVARQLQKDYTDCQGAKDLGSPVKSVYADVWVFKDVSEEPSKADIGKWRDAVLDFTCMVELENGETLSSYEAVEGLGSFAPAEIERRKQVVRDRHIESRRSETNCVTQTKVKNWSGDRV